MTIEEIKQVLGKKATTFVAGGFRPTFQVEESWIGKVEWFLKEEEIPTDDDGLTMLPLMQLYKVGFSIGDSGILFLAKNKETREWLLYWDCY